MPRLLAILGAASVASTGCSQLVSGDRTHPEVPSWYRRPSGVMDVFVHRALTVPGRAAGEDAERGRPEIDAAHERVFVGSSDHGLYALRAGDGSTLWRFETIGVVQSEPLYDASLDVVYFGSNDGALYAVRARDGSLVFRYDTGAEVSKKPVLSGETLLVANAADYLFAIDRRSGKTRWQTHRTPALGMEIAGHSGPALEPRLGTVFMAFSDGHVGAFAARDGSERWPPVDLSADAEQSAGEAPRYLDVDTTPVVHDHPQGPVLYVASYAGGVVALDAQTGSRVWSNDKALGVTDLVLYREPAHAPNPRGADPNGPPVPEQSLLVASSAQSGLMGLDPFTGRVLWRNAVPEGGVTPPAPIAGALLVGTTRYGLFLVSPRNGRVIDGVDLGSGFGATPATYGHRAFALSNQGTWLGIAVESPVTTRPARRDFAL